MIVIEKKKVIHKKWEQILSDQFQSGLTKSKWCAENDINIHSFRYWKRKISYFKSDNSSINNSKPEDKFEWASVLLSSDSDKASRIDLDVSGIKISISPEFDETLLIRLIKVLKKL